MGINLGGLLAPLVCGTLGEMLGWHWGFGAAGVGMLIGLAIYLYFSRLLPRDPPTDAQARSSTKETYSLTDQEWRDLRSLLGIIAVVVLFRIGYEQSGNVIALWVRDETDRTVPLLGSALEIPATWFQAINPLIIIGATPLLIRAWAKRAKRAGAANLLRRMSIGCMLACLAMILMVAAAILNAHTGQPVGMAWVTGYFILLTFGELLVIPVGLTLVESLSPTKIAAMSMGAWYIAKFLGSLLAGVMGAYWGVIPAAAFFGIGAASVFLAAIVLYVMSGAKLRSA
jgi:POT family proton-dependent oligopeptide transporter